MKIMINNKSGFNISLLSILFLFSSISVFGQSFGRNKPHYRSFKFKIKETPHFDLYYYLKNHKKVNKEAQYAELWYRLHQAVFQDTFYGKNPILLYNNHSDFQQTNAISGMLGIGTGGVTEALKNRVVIPLTYTNQQNFHVLGHELVHAFQYHIIINSDSTSLRSLQNLPLWMVEGMAEYLSIGRDDSFTAMWMRDAVLNDDVPGLKKLDDPKYFPYRYGQAFWSFVTGTWGDEAIRPLFINTALLGIRNAIDSTFHISYKQFDTLWVNSINNYYKNFIKYDKEHTIGRKVISDKNAGRMNVSPCLSPNGRYLIFISEKDIFTTDWYLAKANNGKILKKLSSKIRDAHLENYDFLESSGTWSPKSKKIAFVAFAKGRNILVIKDAKTGKTLDEIKPAGLNSFTNPAWSPDGKYIVLTALVDGQTDLYAYFLKNGKVERLTNDIYSEIHSDFSVDGRKLVFSTDELSMKNGRSHGKWTFNIAVLDIATKKKANIPFFPGANNLNPVFDKNNNIYFLSDRDGFRNMYMYDMGKGKVFQKTDFVVGISGITEYSPAISLSKKTDRILYTLYNNKEYSIYQARANKFLNKEVDINDVDMAAGRLPQPVSTATDIVNTNLDKLDRLALDDPSIFKDKPYKPKFRLDYIGGGTSVGVGNATFGTYTGLAGGVDLLFSDILGNNQLYSRLAMNGEIYDFGGQLIYMNKSNRINWGIGVSHIPNSLGYQTYTPLFPLPIENGDTVLTDKYTTNLLRIFDERLSLFWHYPFSTTMRIEGGIGGGFRSFRWDEINDYYQAGTYYYIWRDRKKIPVPDTIALSSYFRLIKGFSSSINIALVGDNSYNGLTSPLAGYRYRIGFEKYFGTDDYYSSLTDFRYYYWLKPVSFAARAMSYLRFENKVNSVYPIYIGQMGLVRGFDLYGFGSNPYLENKSYIDDMLGSKLFLTNFEIRFPFTGIERLSLIKSKYFFSDLALFFDAGVAFDEFSHFKDGEPIIVKGSNGKPEQIFIKPKIVKSVGISLRINLFGALVIEPYYAYPIEKNSRFVFGLNLMPGF